MNTFKNLDRDVFIEFNDLLYTLSEIRDLAAEMERKGVIKIVAENDAVQIGSDFYLKDSRTSLARCLIANRNNRDHLAKILRMVSRKEIDPETLSRAASSAFQIDPPSSDDLRDGFGALIFRYGPAIGVGVPFFWLSKEGRLTKDQDPGQVLEMIELCHVSVGTVAAIYRGRYPVNAEEGADLESIRDLILLHGHRPRFSCHEISPGHYSYDSDIGDGDRIDEVSLGHRFEAVDEIKVMGAE